MQNTVTEPQLNTIPEPANGGRPSGKDTSSTILSHDTSDNPARLRSRKPRSANSPKGDMRKRSYLKPKRSKSVEDRKSVKAALKATIGSDSTQLSNDNLEILSKDISEEKAKNAEYLKVARAHVIGGAFSPMPGEKKKIKKVTNAKKKHKKKTDRPIYDSSDDEDNDGRTMTGLLEDSSNTASTWGVCSSREPSMDLESLGDLAGIGRSDETRYDSPTNSTPTRLRSLLKQPKGSKKSLQNLNRESVRDIRKSLATKKHMVKQGVRFDEHVDSKDISRLRKSAIEDLFYNSTDLADFRQEAFLEECGLDPSEFM